MQDPAAREPCARPPTCTHQDACASLQHTQVATARSQRFLGRELEVLVEGVNPRNPAQAFGRIRHNKLTYFDGDGEALRGQLVTVRIEQANAYSLFGCMVGAVAPHNPLGWDAAATTEPKGALAPGAAKPMPTTRPGTADFSTARPA